MTLTTLDPIPALIIIDLQKGIVSVPVAHSMADVVEHSTRLATAFRRRGFPVVLVNAAGVAPGRTDAPSRVGTNLPEGWTEIVAELDPQPGDVRITKMTWGAFHNTSLHEELQRLGVTQVILTGVATSAGVESTARAAHEHGYHVVLAVDAMTDRSQEAHDNSVELIFPRLGERATTFELLSALEPSPG